MNIGTDLVEKIDPGLIRTLEDASEFNFHPRGLMGGVGLFTSAGNARKYISALSDLDFRVQLPKNPNNQSTAFIFVRKDEWEIRCKKEQKIADKKSMSDFLQVLPILIVVAIISSLGIGVYAAYSVWFHGFFYGLNAKPLAAGLYIGGATALLWVGCFIYWFLNKGRN